MTDNLLKRLEDALNACRMIQHIATAESFDEFDLELISQLAIERLIGTIGEALNVARALDPALQLRIPEINQIIAMRHRLIHTYDNVDGAIVMDVARRRIATLEQQIMAMLGPDSGNVD